MIASTFRGLTTFAWFAGILTPQISLAESAAEKAENCKAAGSAAYVFMLKRHSGVPISDVLMLTEEEPYVGMRELSVLYIEEAYTRPIVLGFAAVKSAQDFSNEMQVLCWRAKSN